MARNGTRRTPTAAGGWASVRYTLEKAWESGGILPMWRALRSRNACKTCALGMGGQAGGMVNEGGHFPSVCKKSVQAMAADMQGAIPAEFFAQVPLSQMANYTSAQLEALGRVGAPLFAGPHDTHYHPVSWEEAIAGVAQALKAAPPDESFFYFSGRSSNEAGFLLQLFARLYGTNNVNNCSYYCHQASGVGLSSAVGSGTATVTLEDLEHCDLLFIMGANPPSNHPRFMTSVMAMKRRGGKVVVVNPMKEVGLVRFKVPSDPWSMVFGTDIADVFIQPHIGGDVAFMTGVAKALLDRDAIDATFVEAHTEGWSDVRAAIAGSSWDDVVAASGVSREALERVAAMYARSDKAIFAWAMGLTHHANGVDNVRMVANLAMMRGMLGKPHAGLLPIRGHSNVQGMGSIGVTPQLKDAIFTRLQETFKVAFPTSNGLDTIGCMNRAAEGGIRFAWCLGGNLYGSNPDAAYASKALRNVDTTVFLSTTMNTGHIHGRGKASYILPVLARDEERQSTTQESMFNFVRLSDGGISRIDELKSEVEVIAAVARKVLGDDGPVDWRAMEEHGRIREAIAEIVPGYEAIGAIGETKNEFAVGGRICHRPTFNTPSGKARFHVTPLPPTPATGALRLMTVRSEGQFNTVVYDEDDYYRGQERRDVILMSREDRERLGLEIDERVTVKSTTGEMRGLLVREIDIRPGNLVAYYPEANVLTPRTIDGESGTPAFKHVAVEIAREVGMVV